MPTGQDRRSAPTWSCGCFGPAWRSCGPHTRHPNWSEKLWLSPTATASSKLSWTPPPHLSTTWFPARHRTARTDNLQALIAAALQVRKLTPSRPPGKLPDPLTDAEVRVLEKLPQHLTYVEMASDLHLSLNTVKTHLRHTYMKLGATSRATAVKRATSLGLL